MNKINILDKEALGNLLRRNWTSFIDKTRLVAFILQQVRDISFPKPDTLSATKITPNLTLTISRAEIINDGLLLWVEFNIPVGGVAKVGTCEATLSLDGNLQITDIIGQTIKLG